MKIEIVAVKDRATETFGTILSFPHTNAAIRWFSHQITEAQTTDYNNMMKYQPQDFDLYHLGTFDDNTGHYTELEEFAKLADGQTIARINPRS